MVTLHGSIHTCCMAVHTHLHVGLYILIVTLHGSTQTCMLVYTNSHTTWQAAHTRACWSILIATLHGSTQTHIQCTCRSIYTHSHAAWQHTHTHTHTYTHWSILIVTLHGSTYMRMLVSNSWSCCMVAHTYSNTVELYTSVLDAYLQIQHSPVIRELEELGPVVHGFQGKIHCLSHSQRVELRSRRDG